MERRGFMVGAAALFLGGTFMAITALGLVGARSLSASDPRRVLALMSGAFGAGQIVGPTLGGALFDRTGSFTLPSLLAAGTLVLAALLGAAVDWRILRAPPKPQAAPRRGVSAGETASPTRRWRPTWTRPRGPGGGGPIWDWTPAPWRPSNRRAPCATRCFPVARARSWRSPWNRRT